MYCGVPVIARASGGPLESIVHGHTGFLCGYSEEEEVRDDDGVSGGKGDGVQNRNLSGGDGGQDCDGGQFRSVSELNTDRIIDEFVAAIHALLDDEATATRMGRVGRAHVIAQFSLDAFVTQLDRSVHETMFSSNPNARTQTNTDTGTGLNTHVPRVKYIDYNWNSFILVVSSIVLTLLALGVYFTGKLKAYVM